MADHNTLIGSTGREIESGTVLLGGVLREIESCMTLVGGVAREIVFADSSAPPTLEPVFADNSWEAIIYACQNKMVPDTWRVADSKTMTIDGEDYQIDIIGKDHDDYADGSGKAPLTFQFYDCYKTEYKMLDYSTSYADWENSLMRKTYLPTIKGMMPLAVQDAIKKVYKRTTAGNGSTTVITTEEDLFLLSEVEIFANISKSLPGEGSRYEYYAAGNSVVKNLNGGATGWYERSPTASVAVFKNTFCCVRNGDAGTLIGTNAASVAPGFCF